MRRVLLLVVCLLCQLAEAHFSTEFPVVSFMGEALPNHTYLDITLVGRRSQCREPLLCHTDLNSCCSSDQGPVHRGALYFPSGVNAGTTNEKMAKCKYHCYMLIHNLECIAVIFQLPLPIMRVMLW